MKRIPKSEIVRDYEPKKDLDPANILLPCDFEEWEEDGWYKD